MTTMEDNNLNLNDIYKTNIGTEEKSRVTYV